MKDEKQIVLFLKKDTKYDNTSLAVSLKDSFPDLGNPAVIPFDVKNPNQPLIIFNQGCMSLVMNRSEISFIYDDNSNNFDLIIQIISFLENEDFDFTRFGYISTFIQTEKTKKQFLKNMLVNSDEIDSDFNFSWHRRELIDSVSVNVWQRELTDSINKIDLISVFDINSPIDEEYNINSEFLENFIQKCDKYIEKKQNEMLK